jgi:hypothetical protein
MKASDLRIGNYVYDTLGKVNKIDLEAITYIVKEPHNQVKPIPLTKEWLLKIGFEFAVDTWYLNGFSLWETEFGDDKGATGIGYFYELRAKGMMDKHIQYLHELQNLYYSLTGEEIL